MHTFPTSRIVSSIASINVDSISTGISTRRQSLICTKWLKFAKMTNKNKFANFLRRKFACFNHMVHNKQINLGWKCVFIDWIRVKVYFPWDCFDKLAIHICTKE